MIPTSYDASNVFARILKGEIPCQKILETDHTLSFYDHQPQAPIHALIITKAPYICFDHFLKQCPDPNPFWQDVQALVHHLNFHKTGYRFVSNNGKGGGQEVPHFHAHLLSGV
jgi:histidine triad (HIT) family protein